MSTVLFPVRCEHTFARGRTGTPVAQSATLCISTSYPDSSHPGQSERTGPLVDPCDMAVAIKALGVGKNSTAARKAMASPQTQRPPISGMKGDLPPPPRPCSSLVLARERWNLNAAGLPEP